MSKVLWHSSEGSFTVGGLATILYNEFENYSYKITTTFRRGKLVKVEEKNWSLFHYPKLICDYEFAMVQE